MIFAFSSALFAPVGGWFVERYGLVPAMRGLLIFAFIMLTVKGILLYIYSHETGRGVQRKEETRHRSLFSLLAEYRSVFGQILHSRAILAALALYAIMNIYSTVSNNFWGVLFSSKLGFSESQISTYVALRSISMTLGFFLIGPRLTNLRRFRLPLGAGFGAFLLSQGILVLMPPKAVAFLVLSVVLEGAAGALVSPMIESLMAVSMETDERARLTAMVSMLMIIFISPFGWIAGQLSALDRSFPFLLNMGLFAISLVVVGIIGRPGFITFIKHSEPGDSI